MKEGTILLVRIYRKKNFGIYKDINDSYIIWNTEKEFNNGHIHIDNYKLAKHIIDLAINNKIPHKNRRNILILLKRISTDSYYIKKINKLLKQG